MDRRDRGVGVQSKGALVARGDEGGDEFAEAGGEGRGAMQDFVSEAGEVLSGVGLEREKMPDLRVLGAASGHLSDSAGIGTGRGIGLHRGQEHGFHGELQDSGGVGAETIVERD
jgi:hypothetical protein